jgi:hypothetical protein
MRRIANVAFFIVAGFAILMAGTGQAFAQKAPQAGMAKSSETGLIRKVVAGSSKIKAFQKPDEGSAEAYDLIPLHPYYVMEEASSGFLKITSVPAMTLDEAERGKIGYVRADRVHEWLTREAFHFLPVTANDDRPIEAWDDETSVRGYFETGDRTTYPPTLRREKALRPYLVIRSFNTSLAGGRAEKRIYEVLLPTPSRTDHDPEGVLVRRGFLPEDPDRLDPQIRIDKDTLHRLVNLFSAASAASINAKDLKVLAAEAIAAIAGERPDPTDDIASVIRKKLGIQFRTNLVNFNVEYLDATTPERGAFQKRMKEAANRLSDFAAAKVEEFEKLGYIWMPVNLLP